jgi:hypothetical protein
MKFIGRDSERQIEVNFVPGHEAASLTKACRRFFSSLPVALLACLIFIWPSAIRANQVPVRYAQGAIHGFLVLQTLDGETLADGDLTQVPKGDRVTGHLVFHFKDGSLYDETFVFTQRGTFHLLSDHLVMKGPTFKQPIETSLNTSTGVATVRYTDDGGKEKVVNEKQPLPTDLANGMIPILATNLQPSMAETKVSLLAATPKPRLVKLAFTPAGNESFVAGGATRKATHYVMKIEIGGVAGAVAPIVGKQPPDTNVWVSTGDAPVFLKMEGPLFEGGPVWRILPVSPAWPKSSTGAGN